MAKEKKQFTIRVEGIANRYGLGEVVAPNVALFKDGPNPGDRRYNLTKPELETAIKAESSRRTIELV